MTSVGTPRLVLLGKLEILHATDDSRILVWGVYFHYERQGVASLSRHQIGLLKDTALILYVGGCSAFSHCQGTRGWGDSYFCFRQGYRAYHWGGLGYAVTGHIWTKVHN